MEAERTVTGCYRIQQKVYRDDRGSFEELFKLSSWDDQEIKFKQCNLSRSKKNVVRGIHFQKIKPQAKLVRVLDGTVLDVVVDLRPDSPTFGYHEEFILTPDGNSIYIPEGFGHGFWVLSDSALFHYFCTEEYLPEGDSGITPLDPSFSFPWASEEDLVISDKDLKLPRFNKETTCAL